MSLQVGDEMLFDGAAGRIVAVTDTTDADGRGAVAYGGQAFRFRALKATGPDLPLVATGDAHFRVGLLERLDSEPPDRFCLVLDDLPAPSGWGRWIQQDRWREASEFAAQDSVAFVLGWRPGAVSIRKGGEPQAGVFADIVLRYGTDEGEHEAWYQPAYPYNDLQVNQEGVPLRGPNQLGCFKTDEDGLLKRHRPDGTLEPIIFPRGLAALGNRVQDRWLSCPQPERYLLKAEVWYLGERAELTEGVAVPLDLAVCGLTITGPPNAQYECFWYEGPVRASGTLDGSGTATVTDLPVGVYTVELTSPSSYSEWLPRQDVGCPDTGGSYSVSFGSSWNMVAAGHVGGRVYLYGSVPAPGLDVWCYHAYMSYPPPGPNWFVCATTDANGDFDYTLQVGDGAALAVQHATSGGVANPYDEPADIAWTPCLAARFACLRESNVGAASPLPEEHEGLLPWGLAGAHQNLYLQPPPRLKSSRDNSLHDFSETDNGKGWLTEPLPRYFWSIEATGQGAGTEIVPEPKITYAYVAEDGEALGGSIEHLDDTTPPWATGAVHSTCAGARPLLALGGKYEGNVVEAARSSPITVDNYPEAFRMGLEFGEWRQPLDARAVSSLSPVTVPCPLTFQAWECPYCGGPAWTDPDGEGYRRGYCMQCADFGVSTDCRTHFITRTLDAGGWHTRWVRNATSGAHVDRLIAGWPRPEEYGEGDEHLVWNWQGFGIPRWVAVHLVFGTWTNGVFTDGESVSDAEARLGRTVGPVMLKFELTADYQGTGQTLRVACVRPDGGSEYRTVTVPAGSRQGDLFPLFWRPHHYYPQGYYVDVTSVEKLAGDGAVYGGIVNDGPAWHSSDGVQVVRAAHSPYACDVALSERDPFLVEDFGGRLHLVYVREGQLMHCVLEGTCSSWGPPTNVSLRANWPSPCSEPSLAPLPHAELLAAAHTRGATRLWRSRDDGEGWE
jgi:hypothetical protein